MTSPIAIAFLISIVISVPCWGQDDVTGITDSIAREGKKLYSSEKASWDGTDIFLNNFKDQRSNIGGYFSYSGENSVTCVFFSREEHPKVLARIAFDTTYDPSKTAIDTTNKNFTGFESDIYNLRKSAVGVINADTFFKSYKNTNFNLIPLIDG